MQIDCLQPTSRAIPRGAFQFLATLVGFVVVRVGADADRPIVDQMDTAVQRATHGPRMAISAASAKISVADNIDIAAKPLLLRRCALNAPRLRFRASYLRYLAVESPTSLPLSYALRNLKAPST